MEKEIHRKIERSKQKKEKTAKHDIVNYMYQLTIQKKIIHRVELVQLYVEKYGYFTVIIH